MNLKRLPAAPSAPSGALRPLEYWLDCYPPGWLSHVAAQDADPILIAMEIQRQAIAFLRWLRLPASERWDTYWLQILSATLFSRYRLTMEPSAGPPQDVPLLALPWPPGSVEIHRRLAELQELLAPPLAVFKATRVAISAADYPTRTELLLASSALEAAADELDQSAAGLALALGRFGSSCGNAL